jgi:hypothetical protein
MTETLDEQHVSGKPRTSSKSTNLQLKALSTWRFEIVQQHEGSMPRCRRLCHAPRVRSGSRSWMGSVGALGGFGGLGGLEGDAGGVGVVFEAELGACGGHDVLDGEAEFGL